MERVTEGTTAIDVSERVSGLYVLMAHKTMVSSYKLYEMMCPLDLHSIIIIDLRREGQMNQYLNRHDSNQYD